MELSNIAISPPETPSSPPHSVSYVNKAEELQLQFTSLQFEQQVLEKQLENAKDLINKDTASQQIIEFISSQEHNDFTINNKKSPWIENEASCSCFG